jgi:hypothetical protein
MILKKRQNRKKSFPVLITPFVLAVLIALLPGCKGKEAEKRQAPQTAPVVTIQNGVTVLALPKAAQERAAISVTQLKPALYRQQFQAYGIVLQPVPLVDVHNNFIAARASVDKAASALDASRKEYERLKKLNEENQNISLKAVQAALAVMTSDQADLSASLEKLQATQQTAAAQWGRVIPRWLYSRSSSPELSRLVELKDVLIKATFPPDKFIRAAPEMVTVQATGSRPVQARLISPAPDTDPRIQGASFFYLAPSRANGLMPGLHVQTGMPVGPNIGGVIIPLPAVIWAQGKAWAYVQTDPEHFSRREVPTSNPVEDGYFVPEGFRPAELIVIRGAQILHSQELLPSRQAGGGGEEDEGD